MNNIQKFSIAGAIAATVGLTACTPGNDADETKVSNITQEQIDALAQIKQKYRIKYNDFAIKNLEETKAASPDGQARIVEKFGEKDVFEIHSTEATAFQFVTDISSAAEEAKEVLEKAEANPERYPEEQKMLSQPIQEFKEYFDRTETVVVEFSLISRGPVTALYNAVSGRICDLQTMGELAKKQVDCFSRTDLTPGTKLANDIDAIDKQRAKQPKVHMAP